MRPASSGVLRLILGLGVIAVVWLVLLPALGRTPELSQRIEREEAQGIDPSAMFWSELELQPDRRSDESIIPETTPKRERQ